MPASDSTLEQFRAATAERQPAPAGVAVAATSASLAFALLAKVLRLSARRDAAPVGLEPLIAAAETESKRMMQLAEQDVTAVQTYMRARGVPHSSPQARQQRRAALDAAVCDAIDLPLTAARAAADGLRVVREALILTPVALIADLGSAAALLSAALRTFLLCAQSNVRLLAPEERSRREALAETAERSRDSLRQTDQLLEHIEATLDAAEAARTER